MSVGLIRLADAPPNCRGPTPPRPVTLQLCPFMVAARLMTLLWPDNTPTPHYPHLTEEDTPGIQRASFGTLYHPGDNSPVCIGVQPVRRAV